MFAILTAKAITNVLWWKNAIRPAKHFQMAAERGWWWS